jgi:hypothetical protein
VAPAQQASNVRFDNIAGSSARIQYDPGDGGYRLIVMKQGSPVDANPVDLIKYNGNTIFMQGQQINPAVTPGNYVLIGGQNSFSLTVTGLSAGNVYHVAVFEFNGNNYPVYARPATTGVLTIPNEPTAPGTNFQATSIEGNSFTAQWSGGNGARRVVIARKNVAVTAIPADGTTYTADPDFTEGFEIQPGQFVIYDGTSRNIPVRNLEIGTTYHFAVYEYNLTGTSPDYLSTALTGQGSTPGVPATQAQITQVTNIQNTQATINYAIGSGGGRLFLMRQGSPVNAEPQDLIEYDYSTTYGSQQLGSTGNYIMQKGNGTSPFTVLGLTPNTQYYVAVFEFNGYNAPVYARPAASFSFTTTAAPASAPTINASNPVFENIDGNRLTFKWDEGNGARRIVVARQGAAVTFTPADGVNYQQNASFSSGTDLGGGQYVVYNGTINEVTITNLAPFTVYHFAVFEFNGTGASIRYLTTNALTASRSTAVTPAGGSTALNGVANNTNRTITITWNSGPGDARLVVMKEGSAVNGIPANLSKYPANSEFENGSQIAAGEYVVYAGTGNTVTVTGLEENKTYHYTVFDYNGAEAPIYNTVNRISGSTLISSPLPLLWLYVRANEVNNGDVKVEWGTTQEYNTKNFIVERSQSNGTFTAIADVPAQGSDIRNDYSFTDRPQTSGAISYRVKQVDIDGRFEYSKQIVVRTISQGTLKLYPNPAPGYTRISLPQGIQQATVKIYNQNGALAKTLAVTNGELISLQGLSKGLYHVVITDGSNQYNEKISVL